LTSHFNCNPSYSLDPHLTKIALEVERAYLDSVSTFHTLSDDYTSDAYNDCTSDFNFDKASEYATDASASQTHHTGTSDHEDNFFEEHYAMCCKAQAYAEARR
jgi:hypothetical protein